MFPVFHHIGNNLTYPEECDCKTLTVEELSSPSHNCNVFRFVSGFIYVNSPSDAVYMFTLRVVKMGTYEKLHGAAFDAMFITSTYGQNSPHTPELNSQESLAAAFDFCTIGAKSCSMITFSSYDLVPNSWAVSEYYTLLQNGACRDSVSSAPSEW
jgi:hypothetical protein